MHVLAMLEPHLPPIPLHLLAIWNQFFSTFTGTTIQFIITSIETMPISFTGNDAVAYVLSYRNQITYKCLDLGGVLSGLFFLLLHCYMHLCSTVLFLVGLMTCMIHLLLAGPSVVIVHL